jgi:hypothetical protein
MKVEHGLVFMGKLDLELLLEGDATDGLELKQVRFVIEWNNNRIGSARDIEVGLRVPDGHAFLVQHAIEIDALTGLEKMLDMLVDKIADHKDTLPLWLILTLLRVHIVDLPMAFPEFRSPEMTDDTCLLDTIIMTAIYEGVQVEFQSCQPNTKFI